MARQKISVVVTRRAWAVKGVYQGGAYIDLCNISGNAFDVINVWDYREDKPMIPFTKDAVKKAINEWFDDMGDDIDHDMSNYAEYAKY